MWAKLKRNLAWLVLAAGLIGLFVAWQNRWSIHDWWRLRGYEPTAEIISLADDTKMTDYGRKIFYVYHPEINEKEEFNQNCTSSESTIVLGCYVSGRGIYLDNIDDERLHGILQVTAAHEMLHAAFDRLGSEEKTKIVKLLNDTFKDLGNERIISTIDEYKRKGANIDDELHSILGTEVEKLPSELESYYKRYFKDRGAIVEFSKKYEAAFTERKNLVKSYDEQLAALNRQIEQHKASLDQQSAQLDASRRQLEANLAAKRYDEYNSGVGPYNAAVARYNNDVRETRRLIDRYNELVAKRNAVALEQNELIQAIDSRPDTIPEE